MATRKPVEAAPAIPTRAQWADYVAAQAAINPAFVPPNQLCVEDLQEWEQQKNALNKLKASEMLMRKRVVGYFFPSPVEGTNNAALPDGTKITLVQPVTRQIDPAALNVLRQTLVKDRRSFLENLKIDTSNWPDEMPLVEALQLGDSLVKWKPELNLPEYRGLNDDQLAVFDSVLTIKDDGSPQLKIVKAE